MDEIKEPVSKLGRRARREYVIKALYMAEFYPPQEREEQVELFLSMENLSEAAAAEVMGRYRWAEACKDNADSVLVAASQGWDLNRIGKAELAIMRLAAAEICSDADVPAAVAINEAVELAKMYGEEQAGSFVNGILGKVAKKYGAESV